MEANIEINDGRIQDLLEKSIEKSMLFGLTEVSFDIIRQANTYNNLLVVALSSLQIIRKVHGHENIVMMSGPLRNGGDGLCNNMKTMFNHMFSYLQYPGFGVFNQLVFFESIIKLEEKYPELDPMEEFFEKILDSGFITHLKMLKHWEESANAIREKEFAEKKGIKIIL